MAEFTMDGATANELEVMRLLNTYIGSSFKKAKRKRSVFDLYGFINKVPTLVEVKERRSLFSKLWLEESKFLSIFAKLKKSGKEGNAYLVISHQGKHYLYDMKDLWRYGTRKREQMNQETAEGLDYQNRKVFKDIIEFNKDSYMVELSSGELGVNYEKN